jgi:transketolase
MLTVAAGMAMSGLRPFVYTIAPFVTVRCLEQIRVDVCYHRTPVVIVGVGGGLAYASLGATHHSCEDIAMLRVLPRMQVVCPGDAWETRAAVKAALEQSDPVYIRLGKKGEPLVHGSEPDFQLGRGITVRQGTELVLLSTGNMLPVAVEVADSLRSQQVDAGVVSLHTVKPIDKELLRECFATTKLVVTLEEHSIIGGLGGAVAEWWADEAETNAKLLRIGTEDRFPSSAGDQAFVREQFGLDVKSIVAKIQRCVAT